MLEKLHIQNYAIIESVTVDFTGGLNIITGETGAGKSILLGAIDLIMGKRADSKALYNPDNKCIVEATFRHSNPAIQQILDEEDLDSQEEIIIRREITTAGKSRAFVNDTPVNLDVLQNLGQHLLDLHQQWDNLDIHRENYQMEMLDAYVRHDDLLATYQKDFRDWKKENSHLAFLESQQEKAHRETEFNRYLLDELDLVQPAEGEQDTLEKELDLLSNAQSIRETFAHILFILEENDPSVTSLTSGLLHDLSAIRDLSPAYQALYDRLFSVLEEIKDMSRESGRIADNTEFNPEKIQEIRERLNTLYKLQKKHGVHDEAGLLAVWENLRTKNDDMEQLVAQIEHSRANIARLEKTMQKSAEELDKNRVHAIPGLVKKVGELLAQLKMEHARLAIELLPLSSFSEFGKSSIKWLFAANKGSALLPLKSVASGGEISRLNLCIKSILASSMTLPTLVFDEIDAGVSGDVAGKMGNLLSDLAQHHQIISITHSPQIAAKAKHHVFVYKDHKGEKTHTGIRILTPEEKVREIAIMLSTDPPSPTALEAARELLESK